MAKTKIHTDAALEQRLRKEIDRTLGFLNTSLTAYNKLDRVSPISIEELIYDRYEKQEEVEKFIRRKTAEYVKNKEKDLPYIIEKLMDFIEVEDCSEFAKAMIAIPGSWHTTMFSYNPRFFQIQGNKVVAVESEIENAIDKACNVYIESAKAKRVFEKVMQIKGLLEELRADNVNMTIDHRSLKALIRPNDAQAHGLLNQDLSVNYQGFRAIS